MYRLIGNFVLFALWLFFPFYLQWGLETFYNVKITMGSFEYLGCLSFLMVFRAWCRL